MADEHYENPRLARLYDPLDPDRSDLDHYAAMVDEFGARSVLDIGAGTGTFACLLGGRGVEVTGIEPAMASIEVARTKPCAERVRWVHGTGTEVPADVEVDMATMTANVAQVFLGDDEWAAVLAAAFAALRPGGHLVFETRDPEKRAWEAWTKDNTFGRTEVEWEGVVQSWVQITDVDLPYVTFDGVCAFERTGEEIVSSSTLRFRSRDELDASLVSAGFDVVEVRDAPDRPGYEFVYVARKP